MSEEAPKEEKKDDAKAAEEKAAAEKKAVEEKAATEKKAADEKAAAEKKAGEEKAAAEKKAAEEKAAAEKAAADKAAADKAAADKAAAEAAAEAAAKAAKAKPKAAGAARGKLLLVAWGPSPAGAWEAALTNAGFEVYVERSARLNAFQWANENQPVAIVIDLSQNPDDGKRLASTLRITGSTATIPLVFCDANAAGAAPITSADAVLGALNKL